VAVTLGDWAAAAGAFFTALAALAALWTARQGRALIEASELPLVEAQVIRDPTTGALRMTVINTGRALARGVNFVVHADGQVTRNFIGDGFLAAGEGVTIATNITLPAPPGQLRHDLPDLAVLVAYRDARGFVHYRTHTEVEHVPRTLFRRRPKYPEQLEVFKKLYPGVDLDAATWVAHNIIPR
jgi:hypothetical protein